MLVGLGDLLRQTLENSRKQKVTLKEELDFLEIYLDLQQMRFPDRLDIQMEIDPDCLDAVVPNMLLLRLVENSIRHGIALRLSKGIIRITTKCNGNELQIRISDNGPGLPPGWNMEDCEGIGLRNTNERLWQLYGKEFRFILSNESGGGVMASLDIPKLYAIRNGC